jgi:hypothetical protein
MMNTIVELIKSAHEVGSKNVLTENDVRHWLHRFLELRQQEVVRFPEEEGLPAWNLLCADYDAHRLGTFVVVVLNSSDCRFAAGRGIIEAIHDFSLNSFPDDVDNIISEVASRFSITGQLSISRQELDTWLAR